MLEKTNTISTIIVLLLSIWVVCTNLLLSQTIPNNISYNSSADNPIGANTTVPLDEEEVRSTIEKNILDFSRETLPKAYQLNTVSTNQLFWEEIKIFSDKSKIYSFEEVRANSALFSANENRKIYSGGDVYWAKLVLQGHPEKDDQYLFDFTANRFDINWENIDAWLVREGGAVEHYVTGSALNKEEKPIPSTLNLLRFAIQQNEKVILYVRLANLQQIKKDLPLNISFNLLNEAMYPGAFIGYPFKGYYSESNPYSPFKGNYIVNHELYQEENGNVSIDHIAANWQKLPITDLFTTTHKTDQVYWMKMRFYGSTHFNGDQILHISSWAGADQFSFDYIDAYVSNGQGGYHHQRTGDHVPLKDRPYNFWANFIKLDISPTDTIDLFVRMEGADGRFLMSNILLYHIDKSTLFPGQINEAYKNGLFYGILGIQALFFLLLFFIERERIHLYFTILVLGLIMSIGFEDENYFKFAFMPEWRDYHIPLWFLGLFISQFGALKFTENYFRYDKNALFSKWILPMFIGISAFVNLYACIEYQYYTEFSSSNFIPIDKLYINLAILVHLITQGIIFSLAFAAPHPKRGEKRVFFIAFLPLMLVAVFTLTRPIAANFFGFENLNDSSVYDMAYDLLKMAIVAMLTLLALSIGSRTNRLKAEKEIQKKQKIYLEDLDRMKSTFFTNISHEFRTPLTVIRGMTNKIKGNEREKQLIHRNTDSLLQLINQILDLSKMEINSLKLNIIQGDIIKYIRYISESFHSLANDTNILLNVDSNQAAILMDYDPEKIRQIVSNLLSNAIKHGYTGSMVKITIEQIDFAPKYECSLLRMTVKDKGVGITPKELTKIFDRFYQADDHASKVGGTGIGLALVKELVELMEGTINVESEEGKGSTFTVDLPITNNAILATNQLVVPSASKEPTSHMQIDSLISEGSDLPLLLIVEDNADVVEYLASCLQSSYQLAFAYNGRIGIEKAIELVPDIIISDVMMPEKDGFEVCATLKQTETTSHIPIILLTAKATVEDKITGLEYGADAYLAKPFYPKELLVRITKLIANRKILQAKYSTALFTITPIEKEEEMIPVVDMIPVVENEFLDRAKVAVMNNLATANFGPNELASELGTSRTQLHRKLKALTDISTSIYIKKIRLQEARKMLVSTDLTISEIAYAVGYSTLAYFSTNFSKEFGCSPTAFRKGLRERGEL